MKKLLALLLLSPLAFADVGNWSKNFYVDDFGDETNDGFISQTVKGKFSNRVTTNSRLRVRLYISNADVMENDPFFRFYEYDGEKPLKGDNEINFLKCKMKDHNNIISEVWLGQLSELMEDQKDYWSFDSDRLVNVVSSINFKELLANEGSARFVCENLRKSTSKYMFELDFKGYNNILKRFSE